MIELSEMADRHRRVAELEAETRAGARASLEAEAFRLKVEDDRDLRAWAVEQGVALVVANAASTTPSAWAAAREAAELIDFVLQRDKYQPQGATAARVRWVSGLSVDEDGTVTRWVPPEEDDDQPVETAEERQQREAKENYEDIMRRIRDKASARDAAYERAMTAMRAGEEPEPADMRALGFFLVAGRWQRPAHVTTSNPAATQEAERHRAARPTAPQGSPDAFRG